MDARIGPARRRTLVGMSLAVAFIPVLLGITACLETPIGDPEKGWVDPRVTGIWLTGNDGGPKDYEGTVWIFDPYDRRTWLVTWIGVEDSQEDTETTDRATPAQGQDAPASDAPSDAAVPTDSAAGPLREADVLRILGTLVEDRAKPEGMYFFKAWLTSIGPYRFLVLEPRPSIDDEGRLRPTSWVAYRLVLKEGRMALALASDAALMKAKTRGEAEQIIARRAAEPGFFDESEDGILYRIPQSGYDAVGQLMTRAGLGGW